MSKLPKGELASWQKLVSSLPIIFLILVSFSLLLFPLKPVHAFTNSRDGGLSVEKDSVSTYTLAISPPTGDLLVISSSCVTGALTGFGQGATNGAHIASITDNAAPANTYAIYNINMPYVGFDNSQNEVWFGIQTRSETSVTVTLTATVNYCYVIATWYNTDAQFAGGNTQVAFNSFLEACVTTTTSVQACTPNSFNTVGYKGDNMFSQIIGNIPPNSLWVSSYAENCWVGGSHNTLDSISYVIPNTSTDSLGGSNCANSGGPAAGLTWSYNFGGTSLNSQSQINFLHGNEIQCGGPSCPTQFRQTVTCSTWWGLAGGTCYEYDTIVSMINVIFISNGVTSIIPPPLITGCTVRNSTSLPVVSNQTYFYLSQIPFNGGSMGNITIFVGSISVASLTTPDKLTLGVYTTAKNSLPTSGININAGNPLVRIANFTWTFTAVTSTFQTLGFKPNVALPPSSWLAITLSTSHDGINVFGVLSPTGLVMYDDTTDGYNPSTISAFSGKNPLLCFYGITTLTPILSIQTNTVVNVTTCPAGSTCNQVVATSYVTSIQYIYSLNGSQGSVALVQDITAFLPLWFLPLALGAWFGLIGLFIGLILGLGIGTLFGIIPIWFAFLLGMGLLFLMSKLR